MQEMEPEMQDSKICDSFSWRGLLSKKYNLANLNLSQGASSNQRQFRLAIEFFGSSAYENMREQYDRIVVLWGITSTARNEIWSVKKNNYDNFLLSMTDNEIAQFIAINCYDHDCEVYRLRSQMLYWNVFFESQHIKNFWFDTFNTHHYNYNFKPSKSPKTYVVSKYSVVNQEHYCAIAGPDWPSYPAFCQGDIAGVDSKIIEEILHIFPDSFFLPNYCPTTLSWHTSDEMLDPITNLLDFDRTPRDLMSWLMMQNNFSLDGCSQSYHNSGWQIDRAGMHELVDAGILNPHTHHPTKLGHRQLCDYFADKIQAELA